jgi:hypothetical protein
MAGGINQKKVRRKIHLARHHAYHNKRNVQNIRKGKFIQKKMKYIILDEVWIMDGGKENHAINNHGNKKHNRFSSSQSAIRLA